MLGAFGVMAGFSLADPIVGILITIAILFVLKSAARDVYRRLMDGVDPDVVAAAENALAATPGVHAVESVRVRWIGHRLRVEADVMVDPALSVVEGHGIATDAHHRLLHEVPKLADATIHVSPEGPAGAEQHATLDHHTRPGSVPGSRPGSSASDVA